METTVKYERFYTWQKPGAKPPITRDQLKVMMERFEKGGGSVYVITNEDLRARGIAFKGNRASVLRRIGG